MIDGIKSGLRRVHSSSPDERQTSPLVLSLPMRDRKMKAMDDWRAERVKLAELIVGRIGQEFDGECRLTEDEAREIASALTADVRNEAAKWAAYRQMQERG